MEVVLGIDNLIFISILTNKLPEARRSSARRIGIGLAVFLRLGLLASVAVIAQLTTPLFTLFGHAFSWRDLILMAGGLFLIWKATTEIHEHVAGEANPEPTPAGVAGMTMAGAIGQILLLDLVFSLDSIITAIGMTNDIPIMVLAVLVAVGLMLLAADPLASFIGNNPTIVMLALGFLLMIGATLLADGVGLHVPEGLHLRRHGVLRPGRGPEHAGAEAAEEEVGLLGRATPVRLVFSDSLRKVELGGAASLTRGSNLRV